MWTSTILDVWEMPDPIAREVKVTGMRYGQISFPTRVSEEERRRFCLRANGCAGPSPRTWLEDGELYNL